MLIVHRLHPGAHRYYLSAVGPGGQGDAPRLGEAAGRWTGAATGKLDLHGEVAGRDLRAVLVEGRGRVPGFDLTFAAPKSVSVLHALGPTAVSDAVRRAHDDAVAAGLAYLGEHACVIRMAGRPVAGGGFVAAAFRHRVSRASDPHLHTHVVVANRAPGPDGAWRALDSPILYGEAVGAAAAYHVTLRGGLTAALGLAWNPPTRGRADAAVVPEDVRAAFSRRRAMVLAEAADRLADRGWAERVTRASLEGLVDYDRLSRIWDARAASLSWAAPETTRGRPPRVGPLDDTVLPADDRWTRGDLMVAVADRWRDGASYTELRSATARLLESERVRALGRPPTAAERFSTTEAQARRRDVDAALSVRRVDGAPEVLDALRRGIAADGGRLVLVVGDRPTADRLAARTGAHAVSCPDAPRAIAALDGRDAVVVCRPGRLPSLEVQAVLAAAEASGVPVAGADHPRPGAVVGPPDGPGPGHRVDEACVTVAVPGGDLTASATARAAADLAVSDWAARRRAGHDAVLVADVVEIEPITGRARAALRDAGLLGPVEVGGYATGDRVRFTRGRPVAGLVRHSHGEVVAVDPRRGLDIVMSDGRPVTLGPAGLTGVTHAHVVPPVPALVAGRGDVFVIGARTFAARHLDDSQTHRYVTLDRAALASRSWATLRERGWADEAAAWHAPRPPGPEREPQHRSLPLAERARERSLGLSR